MQKPTHEEISQRAHRLWQESGSPSGDGMQNWLNAERELSSAASGTAAGTTTPDAAALNPLSEGQSTHAAAERETQQRKDARGPVLPTHTGPKPIPAVTGKPLWNQPHSS